MLECIMHRSPPLMIAPQSAHVGLSLRRSLHFSWLNTLAFSQSAFR